MSIPSGPLPRKKAMVKSWTCCSALLCLNSVCFEPAASIPISPPSFVVFSGIACANLLSVVLPVSSVSYAPSTLATRCTSELQRGLNPRVNLPAAIISRKWPVDSNLSFRPFIAFWL